MDYKGMICDGCREPFEEDDDVVVCPECGTPQHRSCYEKNNRCVNEYLHSPDFSWSRPQAEPEAVKDSDVPEPSAKMSDSMPNGGYGGRLQQTTPLQMEEVFMRGVLYDPKDDIGGATVGEAADYIQSGVPRYISKLMKRKNKKLSWNWAAFFFGSYWYFYRKLYKAGAFFLALSVSLTLVISPAVEKLQSQIEPIMNRYAENVTNSDGSAEEAENNELLAQMQEVVNNGYPTIILELLSLVVPNIIAALLANYLLKRKMLKVVELAHSGSKDPNTVKYTIMRNGGVSVLMPVLAALIDSYLPSLLLSIAYNIK